MKNRLLWLVFVLATTVRAATPDLATPLPLALKPFEQHPQAALVSASLLTRLHYKALPLDDALSKKTFDQYLKALDPDKFYFMKADIEQMAGFSSKLDDAILDGDLSIPFAIFNLYAQRTSERLAYARLLLKEGFDFAQKESYDPERKKKAWPESRMDSDELWRKRVKNDWLLLKLTGQDEASIIETLGKRYESAQKRVVRATSEEVFQTFMNSYTTAIDPHTGYLGPRAAKDFEVSMSLSLSGIGAALSEKDERITIQELIPGGPAILSEQLQVGDRILGVGEGENGAMTDIGGWRLDDAVALIRGTTNSTLRLDVLPVGEAPDGSHKRVTLVRKRITLDDQSARKSILSVADGAKLRHIGVITLPSFYLDFEAKHRGDPDFKSATRDVLRILEELKQEKVDGVLLDLRNNGGGSLVEAVELAALFVGTGPVVQQRDARGEIKVASGSKGDIAWVGPLGVLINRGSASASEIFAAAIQDYQRGLVIGEPSFGKGTVQALINLDDLAHNEKPRLGELKVTIAQFFRINGGTTQRRGVTPDIFFPTLPNPEDYGEASFGNALPWVKIKPVAYSPAGDVKALLPALALRHHARMKTNKGFQNLQENLAELKRLREKTTISLNETERRLERNALMSRLQSREARSGAGADLLVQNLRDSAHTKNAILLDDSARAYDGKFTGEQADKKAEAKDILLIEAVHIVSDGVALLTSGSKLADRAKPLARHSRSRSGGFERIAGGATP